MKEPARPAPKVSAERIAAREVMRAAERLMAVQDARDHLLPFTKLMMPDPNDVDDVSLSRYDTQHFHTLIAEALEKVEKGEILRLIITAPPRHGKSQLCSRSFAGWYMGRNPYNAIILTSYNDKLAQDVGNDVRTMMLTPMYKQVFPKCAFRKGSQSVEKLQTTEGGMMVFVGAGGTISGRGGDVILIDDPIKGSEDADSASFREKQWNWFTQDVMSRLMTSMGAIIIIMTRWHEDDIVGRLTDRKNPSYREEEAKHWQILHLPGLAEENDPLGRAKDEALWPTRHNAERLKRMRVINSRGFNANYQGRPTPVDGEFFKRSMLYGYQPHELPKNLRKYCASDHALGTKQQNDKTCLLPIGVDQDDVIWVLPDVEWGQFPTDQTVEKMIDLMERHDFLTWWGENEHIMKSIGPFLRKRMMERGVYCNVEPVTANADKRRRAQSILGRMSMRMVRFPVFAPWWGDAQDELLKFDRGRHDDFVDALAHVGRGLGDLIKAPKEGNSSVLEPKPGSLAWFKWNSRWEKQQRDRSKTGGF